MESKPGMGQAGLKACPTLGALLSALCRPKVDRGHEADKLHGLCFHQAGVLPVPASTLQIQASNPDTVLGRHRGGLRGSRGCWLPAPQTCHLSLPYSTNCFPPLLPAPSSTRPAFLCSEPQAHLAPTLGGYTRLLSSTVETINSQERLSTDIWKLKVRIREDPPKGGQIHVPSIQFLKHSPHGSRCFGELKIAVQQ